MLNKHRSQITLWLFVSLFFLAIGRASACPFCTALKPTLSQQRESAMIVALGEVIESAAETSSFQIHQTLVGKKRLRGRSQLTIPQQQNDQAGRLVLLIADRMTSDRDNTVGEKEADTLRIPVHSLTWKIIPVNETGAAYFARAPSLRVAPTKRLAYFAKYLEHSDALIAEDAYQEFGHAAYSDVVKVASHFDNAKLREWVTDEKVSQDRKGFYAIALSMANDPKQRAANVRLLRHLIDQPADDFRAGFDGILGAYLVTKGDAGLDLIESRYLANRRSGDGDVRSAIAALRFYFEFGSKVSPARLRAAMRHLLLRPEFAHVAVIDLARWEDWEALGPIVKLYDKAGYPQPATRRAVVGYLSASPSDSAAEALNALRDRDPKGVAEAEQRLLFSGASSPQDQ